ncbi:hypothetical protein PFISCL1PPCAC_23161, partial [Pristionchus fissidentatus]
EEKVRTFAERFDRLKRRAEAKLDEASSENAKLVANAARVAKAHDQDTVVLRMRVKKAESEVIGLQQNLQLKKKQNAE